MSIIYENKVVGMGECVEEFKGEGIFIIFGDNAPEELKDYCYSVSLQPINGQIMPGQILSIDDNHYTITAVGPEAPVTLAGLGHCTVNFNGSTEVELPGTIYVENKPMPDLHIGTVIRISDN